MSDRKHVMIDLETLSTRNSAVVLSVGAVQFFPNAQHQGEFFYSALNITDQLKVNRTIDGRTLSWWMDQTASAREVFDQSSDIKSTADILKKLAPLLSDAHVWGNGADFDNAILASLYEAFELPVPWKFYNNRCFRTLKNLYEHVPREKPPAVAHNALDDARAQAQHAALIFMHCKDPAVALVREPICAAL